MSADRPDHPERPDLPGIPPPTDEELALLVRDVTTQWHLPPQRLDQPTWRDRVAGRRLPSGRFAWLPRLAGAATVAVVALVVVAMGVAWLNNPPGAGKGPSATPFSSTAHEPTPTPLPKLAVYSEAPQAAAVVLEAGDGLARVDLRSGDLAATGACSATQERSFLPLPNGGVLGLCLKRTTDAAGERVVASLDRVVKGSATATRVAVVGTYDGRPDPATAGAEFRPPAVSVAMRLSPDGRVAYVGWAAQQGSPTWRLGIDVVDLASGLIAQRLTLPDQSSGHGDGWFEAPRLRVAPDARHGVIRLLSYPGTGEAQSSRYWDAAVSAAGQLGAPRGWGSAAGSLSAQDCWGTADDGFASSSIYFAICAPDNVLREVSLDGTPIGDSAALPGGGTGGLIDRAGGAYLGWDPMGGFLARVDLATRQVTSHAIGSTASGEGPLEALGQRLRDWLVPSIAAKVFLSPAMVLSPDGTRLYVLGVGTQAGGSDLGSTGIWVVDPRTLEVVAHWPPTGDFTSMALSADGAELYAAASSVGSNGTTTVYVPASVTVFDTRNGTVKAIAGQLGEGMLRFATEAGGVVAF